MVTEPGSRLTRNDSGTNQIVGAGHPGFRPKERQHNSERRRGESTVNTFFCRLTHCGGVNIEDLAINQR
uniref:Uncharacterized protein n=1 Tax=Knipowitschia caucasica TaxID=637954 RepID=A0AAV2JGA3_KNICA